MSKERRQPFLPQQKSRDGPASLSLRRQGYFLLTNLLKLFHNKNIRSILLSGGKMIGVLYIVLLVVCAILYVESQAKAKRREVYLWHLSITSMAAVGLIAWWSDSWELYCYGGCAVAVLMAFANHGWPKKSSDDDSWVTWTGRNALYNVIAAMVVYAAFVLMIASPEPGENKEWLILWMLVVVTCLFFTYTKRGAQFASDMIKDVIKHRSRR